MPCIIFLRRVSTHRGTFRDMTAFYLSVHFFDLVYSRNMLMSIWHDPSTTLSYMGKITLFPIFKIALHFVELNFFAAKTGRNESAETCCGRVLSIILIGGSLESP